MPSGPRRSVWVKIRRLRSEPWKAGAALLLGVATALGSVLYGFLTLSHLASLDWNTVFYCSFLWLIPGLGTIVLTCAALEDRRENKLIAVLALPLALVACSIPFIILFTIDAA